MRLRISLCLLLFSLPLPGPVNETQEVSTGLWQSLAPGIQYREFYLPTPNHVYVARMDRAAPGVTLETSISQGRLSGELETVRDMAARYDQAINYWGEDWGTRNQVVVAINGYFFDTETGVPWSGQVHSGWYAKRFDERQSGSGFAWTLDKNAFIGGCVVHPPSKQVITHFASGSTQPFDGINLPRSEDELIIYTPQYDATTLTDEEGIEVLVELKRPMMIIPSPAMINGKVREIRDGYGSTPIPFDHVVLSASGEAENRLRGSLAVGDEIGISQEIRHLESDCSTPLSLSWTKTYAALGGSFVFLRDGVIQGLHELGALLHNPRTAIAFNGRYIYFIVVDGRSQLRSLGMSMADIAVFAKLTLGAVWGVALDGGGSSTIVVNGEVKNKPNAELASQWEADGPTATVPGKNIPASKAQMSSLTPPPEATLNNSTYAVKGELGDVWVGNAHPNIPHCPPNCVNSINKIVERVVANGLMMVVVQPREHSSRFNPGDRVFTTDQAQVQARLGPGSNYAALAALLSNREGLILDHPMRGVLAKGSYWWKVNFGEVAGWVPEEYLAHLDAR